MNVLAARNLGHQQTNWCARPSDRDQVEWPGSEFTNSVVTQSDRCDAELDQSQSHLRSQVIVYELAIFSDGIENLVLHKPSRSVHQAFFKSMIEPIRMSETEGIDAALSEALRRYLSSAAICERTDDDKTLVLASRMTFTADKDAHC